MNEQYRTYYKVISILIDLFLINLAGYIGYVMTYQSVGFADLQHINLLNVLLINFVWFNVTQLTRLYSDIFVKDAIPTIKQALGSLLLFAAFMSILIYTIKDLNQSYQLLSFTFVVFSGLFLVGKIVFLLFRRSRRESLINYKKVVIVGAGPLGLALKKHMEFDTHLGYKVVGFFDDHIEDDDEGFNILGKVSDCIEYVKGSSIREIFCTLPDSSLDKINTLMREADKEMIRFKLVPDIKHYFKKNVKVQVYGHIPILSQRMEPLEIMINQVVKRIFDVVFSLIVIVFVMSWMLPLMAILIKFESKGPVFFKQLRSGKDNQPFYCLKFRSMKVNSDADCKQATKHDDRITKIGAFMRKNSIDELPQFFNVLMGEMSVVGPRPHMLQHTAEYSAIIDQFMVRHFLLPGITGWAQVKGFRGETKIDDSMAARVEADIWYLENWSFLLDLKIVFLTAWQVLTGHENAR
ncbi:undecaprenyl-phosphate glucose phosphotransferase [Pedobacter panaciterrae]|uniref:undecaprenyl-phosphate glucose phosphotransferase n=1 Tax=Pedobacter panaciterrae TaxID=363849 RepID=UPI00155DC7EA|nr:undecaprenyl-phosphate glucose phosphotransferase [Pedobacter panaciterrae]NQX55219.1 undecaprenyl-phosphate glucose phosphotransferase [Pedobacter panaciterrae]